MYVCVYVCVCVCMRLHPLFTIRTPSCAPSTSGDLLQFRRKFKSTHTEANLFLLELMRRFIASVRIAADFHNSGLGARGRNSSQYWNKGVLSPRIASSDCHLKAPRPDATTSFSSAVHSAFHSSLACLCSVKALKRKPFAFSKSQA